MLALVQFQYPPPLNPSHVDNVVVGMSWLAVRERTDVRCFLSRLTWKVGRVWFNATVLKTVEQKCSVGSNPTLSSTWMVDRVAYCISLLKRRRLKATTGSNPVPSSRA